MRRTGNAFYGTQACGSAVQLFRGAFVTLCHPISLDPKGNAPGSEDRGALRVLPATLLHVASALHRSADYCTVIWVQPPKVGE